MKIGLAWAMLREHRWSYAGLGLVLTAAAAVVGSSLVLRSSAHRTTPDASGLTPNESAKLKILSESGQTASLFIAVLGGFVAIFIVMQTMSFVVDSRQTELARLRLAGGSSSQVTSLILCECALLGLLASTIGSFVVSCGRTPMQRFSPHKTTGHPELQSSFTSLPYFGPSQS